MSSSTDEDILDDVGYVTLSAAALSCLGSAFIIVTYVIWPELRTTSRQILVFLSIADYANALGNGCGAYALVKAGRHSPVSCKLQSFITTASSLALFAWTVAMAVYLYVAIVQNRVKRAKKLLPFFHIICWGIPLTITSAALGWDALGDSKTFVSGGWCWIRRDPPVPHFQDDPEYQKARLFWMLVTGKAWEIAACIATPCLYILIKMHVRKETMNGDQFLTSGIRNAAAKVDRKLVAIPAFFVLLRVWGTARFFIDIIDHPTVSLEYPALVFLQSIGDTSQGFVNFVIFCWFTEKIRHRLVASCCSWHYRNVPISNKGERDHPGNAAPSQAQLRSKLPSSCEPSGSGERDALLNASTSTFESTSNL